MLKVITRYRSLSNIMLIDKATNRKQMPHIVSKETCRSIKKDLVRAQMPDDVKFNEKLFKRVKRILEVGLIIELAKKK